MLQIIENGLNNTRIVDLNLVLIALMTMIRRHRRLVGYANIKGPFYVKAYIENMWRTVPFIDLPAFLDQVSEYGFPIVQSQDVLVPNGTSLDTFVVLPERDAPKSEDIRPEDIGEQVMDAQKISYHILEAFGITSDVMMCSADLFLRYCNFTQSENTEDAT